MIASQPYITSEDGARPHQGRAMQDRAYGFPRRPQAVEKPSLSAQGISYDAY